MHKLVRGTSLLLIVIAVLLYTGCAQNAVYHDLAGTAGNCVSDDNSEQCTRSYYQEHGTYDLAFAEFSERGNAFDNTYIDNVFARIRKLASDDGVVLVVFIHGWKNNANEENQNLIDFKASLQTLGGMLGQRFSDQQLGKRRLVGLYVGWRGESIRLPGLKQVTFWDRKEAAEEVGRGGVTSLLLRLDRMVDVDPKNAMVVVGHSFGGAILLSSLSEVLTERVTQRTRKNYARTIGDGLLLLNPAIEANQALSLVEAAIKEDYKPEQYPVLISLSSDADSATHKAFPLGQTLGLALTWRRAEIARDYLVDREPEPPTSIAMDEAHLDGTTVGNFAPFLTHRLQVVGEDDHPKFEFTTCQDNPVGCGPAGWTTLDGMPTIRTLPANYPLYFIKTDESMIEDHNDIFNSKVRAFVIAVIDDVVRRKLNAGQATPDSRPKQAPTILGDTEGFERKLDDIYRQIGPAE